MSTPSVPLRSTAGRWLLLATILGSSMAMLDATVVNIALPDISRTLDADLAGLQWVLNGYTLALASLILVAGNLGDRLGRRRTFLVGVVWFAIASALCGLAPTAEVLVAARVLQGIGAALLTPGSLALISATVRHEDRGAAIGAWSGLGGVAGALGPLLGGWLVDVAGWRAVFWINLPLAAVVVAVTVRHVPESLDPDADRHTDVPGVVLTVGGLAILTYGLTIGALLPSLGGLLLLVLFVLQERRSTHPLVPLGLFSDRVFAASNAVTLCVYAALGGTFFLLVLHLQVVAGYSPLAAGASTVPITLIMLTLSSRAGALSQRLGPRLPMTVGPLVAAAGLVLTLRIGPGADYVQDVLPAVVVFGLGLATLVAPLTTAVLGSAPDALAGTASGVNNAVARTAQLLAVAALPAAVGLDGTVDDAVSFAAGFERAMVACAVLLVLGSLTAAVLVRRVRPDHDRDVATRPHCGVTSPSPGVDHVAPSTPGEAIPPGSPV
ncbi:MFS transporter [Solicola sp. PLA-1-18]|uniref:MFS transporter n=1 Tax=Solicola sp. PLA-1-18 TaxID=3380532 RepID=UPI003B7F2648